MLVQIMDLFSRVFNFYTWVMSFPVLDEHTLLDVVFFGFISTATMRFLILPAFGKFGGFGSSSSVRKKDRPSEGE